MKKKESSLRREGLSKLVLYSLTGKVSKEIKKPTCLEYFKTRVPEIREKLVVQGRILNILNTFSAFIRYGGFVTFTYSLFATI